MMENVVQAMRAQLQPFELTSEAINCHHNYVERETHFGRNVWLTRKGAIRAREGDLGIIPGVLLGALPNFDRKVLLSPAALAAAYTSADGRPAGSKAATKEARSGDLGSAAMTALGDGDQVLAMFL